jgi:hypothetical protein
MGDALDKVCNEIAGIGEASDQDCKTVAIQLGAMIIKEHPELACPGVAYRLAVMLQDMSRLEAHKRLRKERDNEKVF